MEAKNQYVTQIDQLRSDKKELESEVSLIESILKITKKKQGGWRRRRRG